MAPSHNNFYTIAWICPSPMAFTAAQEFLDSKHELAGRLAPKDKNRYVFGKIGPHLVVIALMTDESGTSGGVAAANMQSSFPKIQICLLVGTAGGAPSKKHDIRLGDVVVCNASAKDSGVFQYDFGKRIQGVGFLPTRTFNPRSHDPFADALNKVHKAYAKNGALLDTSVQNAVRKSNYQNSLVRPHPSTDRLFRSDILHPRNETASCSSCNPAALLPRAQRSKKEGDSVVHHGMIGTADMLLKNAVARDQYSAERGVLCFERGAAGVVNVFPSLVIRGIENYTDTHNSKAWEGYAAMAAAAYAKDVLSMMPMFQV